MIPKTRLFVILLIFSLIGMAGTVSMADQSPPNSNFMQQNPPPDGKPQGLPPGDAPPQGGAPGGAAPGNGSGSSSYNLSGAYTVDGTSESKSDETFTSDSTDLSAIYVTNGGSLDLVNPIVRTTGGTSSSDASSFYGLNGAVLANNGSTVTISGGSIITTGSGANGVIPTGPGTSVTLSDLSIKASGDGGHGVMATLGGMLTLKNVDIDTTGSHGAPLATDRGSGTITVTGGTVKSSGADSPGIYSTGNISVTDATITSTGTEAAVIEGFNNIVLKNTTLSGGVTKTGAVMIYQSMSGDAETGTGVFTMTDGSLIGNEGPLFFITNTDAIITLKNVFVTGSSDILVNASGTSRWGTTGKNGGIVTFTADSEKLQGSLITDNISTISAKLLNNSELTGTINEAALEIDATSSWNVTGNSVLSSLSDRSGVSGTTITNIYGNGFTVTYDTDLTSNSDLGGKTYTLTNGGTLAPR